MSRTIPVGERESQTLEFKSQAALAKPELIARAVVAMLNAEGGEVWVGLRDQGDVAVELEGVEDPETARGRLHDSLIDRIEPSPDAREVRVEVVPAHRDLLRIEATPREERRPYALVVGQGREYPVRIGSRVRSLSREEIGALFARSAPSRVTEDSESVIKKWLLAEQEKVLESEASVLWIGVVPSSGRGQLSLEPIRGSDLLLEPERSGSHGFYSLPAALRGARLMGRLDVRSHPVSRAARVDWTTRSGDQLSLDRAGALFVRSRLDPFAGDNFPDDWSEPILLPEMLIGWVVSIFRILARLYSEDSLWDGPLPGLDAPSVTSLVVTGLKGWWLLPGRLPRNGILTARDRDRARQADQDFVLDSPLALKVSAIREEPDRCALRLLTKFYEAFGLIESDIPLFDHATERFDWNLSEAGQR